MKLFTLLLSLALTLVACSTPPSSSTPLSGELQIPLGESRPLPGTDRPVEFVEVLEDSRCPADAMCVWQGRVQVHLAVTLGTEQVPDFTLSLTAVDPYPGTAAGDGTPMVTLKIEPLSSLALTSLDGKR